MCELLTAVATTGEQVKVDGDFVISTFPPVSVEEVKYSSASTANEEGKQRKITRSLPHSTLRFVAEMER